MKYLSALLLAFAVPSAFGIVMPQQHFFEATGEIGTADAKAPVEELRLVQISPAETRWVTEEQKLELKRVRDEIWPRATSPNANSCFLL